jgi:hypothetical protein
MGACSSDGSASVGTDWLSELMDSGLDVDDLQVGANHASSLLMPSGTRPSCTLRDASILADAFPPHLQVDAGLLPGDEQLGDLLARCCFAGTPAWLWPAVALCCSQHDRIHSGRPY